MNVEIARLTKGGVGLKFSAATEKNGKKSQWAIVSSCGKYHIAKHHIKDQTGYLCWFNQEIIGCADDASEAREICRAHKQDRTKLIEQTGCVPGSEWFAFADCIEDANA